MIQNGLPKKQGLYDPQFEHDNCGIGCLVNIKGKKSHKIINDAIEILKNLTHRGGVGSEPDTGDGAGILIQIPHNFMKKVCDKELSFQSPVITVLVCFSFHLMMIQEQEVFQSLKKL